MLSEDLEYKIHKYSVKFRNAKSNEKSNYYQKKLQHYHRLNQFGGADVMDSDINTKINKAKNNIIQQFDDVLTEVLRKSNEKCIKKEKVDKIINELRTIHRSNIDEIKKVVARLYEKETKLDIAEHERDQSKKELDLIKQQSRDAIRMTQERQAQALESLGDKLQQQFEETIEDHLEEKGPIVKISIDDNIKAATRPTIKKGSRVQDLQNRLGLQGGGNIDNDSIDVDIINGWRMELDVMDGGADINQVHEFAKFNVGDMDFVYNTIGNLSRIMNYVKQDSPKPNDDLTEINRILENTDKSLNQKNVNIIRSDFYYDFSNGVLKTLSDELNGALDKLDRNDPRRQNKNSIMAKVNNIWNKIKK